MQIITGRAYSWADGIPGWVTLHAHEHNLLAILMHAFKSPKIEEIELEITQGGKKGKYYRIFVENLGLAYEALSVARLAKRK